MVMNGYDLVLMCVYGEFLSSLYVCDVMIMCISTD